ncbi:MAG TPA: glycosyltransferase N-terminal domain-containing protein [Candidatus Saccharimonadaceae bacterium]|nr:glycosyltransferase N-terminal domain-containing protein [Candidatus Saccharimonadaceae bacterium]
MSVLWATYRLLAPALGAMAPAARLFTSPVERPLWGERLGRVSLPGGCDAWVHAASLGEATAVRPLVEELRALAPEATLYLTSTTRTGRARLQALGLPLSLAPLDAPQSVARFFAGVAPRRLFVVETELWPHWLLAARARRVPVAIVSARLSARSVRGYRRLGADLRRLVEGLDAVLCQGEEDAARWIAIGAEPERVAVVGNLKADALPRAAPDRRVARAALGLEAARPLLVVGSLRRGEGHIVARAWRALPEALRATWQVVVVPRHARAADELREEARAAGVPDAAPGGWRWDERSGVLLDYYRAADVALVGGSLVPLGGHNPLEPAACGAAVIVGEHHEAQAEGVAALDRSGAVWVVRDAGTLAHALAVLLGDEAERVRRSRAGRDATEALRGAARRAARELAVRDLWPVRA